MTRYVSADPELLETFTRTTVEQLPPVRSQLRDYRRAIGSYNVARNDLGHGAVDPSASISGWLDTLEEIDRAPTALARALRSLDAFYGRLSLLDRTRFGELELIGALVSAAMAAPATSDDELLEIAVQKLDRRVRHPFEDGLDGWASETIGSGGFWANTSVGAAFATVQEVDRRLAQQISGYTRADGREVSGYARWRAGHAERMNRVMSARQLSRLTPWARAGGRALPFLGAAAGQYLDNRTEPDLTTGDEIARVGVAVGVEGLAAFGGAKGGAALGALALSWAAPPVGPIIGGVVGGALGGFAGSQFGRSVMDNATGLVESAGRGVDRILETASDVGSWAASGMSGMASSVAGWFGR